MLPDGGQDGPGSATDVMPAFARGHLGEADGSMSTPLLTHHPPSVQLAPCLIRHRGGGRRPHGPLHVFYIQLLRVCGEKLREPSRSSVS